MGVDEKFTTSGTADPPPPPPPPHLPPTVCYQGVNSNIPRPPPAFGYPQPMPPPGASAPPQYYDRGYQTVPGYAVEGRPVNERRLPCCGLGCGWFLFIIGFFLAGIPWYIAVLLLICGRRTMDHREKPGYIACTIAAVLAAVATIIGATKGSDVW